VLQHFLYGHGHSNLTGTVANGGHRYLTAAQHPNPHSDKGTFAKHSGIIGVKKNDWVTQILHAIVELKPLNLYIIIGL
jgi:hypothetical protein